MPTSDTSRELSERAQSMLGALPPYYRGEPAVEAFLEAVASELGRLEDRAEAVREGFFPQQATDELGILSLHEFRLGLPIAPDGLNEEQRRDKVLAMSRQASSGQGRSWTDGITRAIGSSEWSPEENTPGDYQLTLNVPFAAGSDQVKALALVARRLTPANLEIIINTGDGFIVGISEVGDPI